ncbi:MAG: MarR family transcriptional regulator, partial [Myxococcales bacterium]
MAGVDRHDATRALEQELGVLMHRLRQVMGERARLVHPEVNVAGYNMLMALQESPQRASELAEAFAIDKGAVSRLIS